MQGGSGGHTVSASGCALLCNLSDKIILSQFRVDFVSSKKSVESLLSWQLLWLSCLDQSVDCSVFVRHVVEFCQEFVTVAPYVE